VPLNHNKGTLNYGKENEILFINFDKCVGDF